MVKPALINQKILKKTNTKIEMINNDSNFQNEIEIEHNYTSHNEYVNTLTKTSYLKNSVGNTKKKINILDLKNLLFDKYVNPENFRQIQFSKFCAEENEEELKGNMQNIFLTFLHIANEKNLFLGLKNNDIIITKS
jgi:hypothetical protein